MTELEDGDLTEKIIGAAIDVHRELGPGFLGSIYENALMIELSKRNVRAEQQVERAIHYQGQAVGVHRLDIVVENRIVVELKAIKDFEDIHFAVVRSYLRVMNANHGLLLNFGKKTLQIKRVSPRPW